LKLEKLGSLCPFNSCTPKTIDTQEIISYTPSNKKEFLINQFNVAGFGGAGRFKVWLSRQPRVSFLGAVAQVETLYAASAVMIDLLRAGRGTRVKLLEAIAFRRPIVATKVAAYGRGLEYEQHYLRADTSEDVVRA